MATREPSQSEVTSYFKAMAEGRIQAEDMGGIGKPIGGRSNRVLYYRMTYPDGPVNPPVQKVASSAAQQAVAQAKEEVKAELGIKEYSRKRRHHSQKRKRKDNNDDDTKRRHKRPRK